MTSTPSPWLLDHGHLLPASGRALDLACGRGRNAIWLAQRGLFTLAVDRDAEAVQYVNEEAARLDLPLHAELMDLESLEPTWSAVRASLLTPASFDLIVVVHYLHRPLCPELARALRPGGLLVYETFTREQAARGKPTNPAFLLEPGELATLLPALEIEDQREGEFEGRMIASVIARAPSAVPR